MMLNNLENDQSSLNLNYSATANVQFAAHYW